MRSTLVLAGLVLAGCAAEPPASRSDTLTAAEFVATARLGDFYRCSDGDTDLIARLSGVAVEGTVDSFHVQIYPVSPAGPTVGHAPFAPESFTVCREDPFAAEAEVVRFDAAGFEEGFRIWEQEKGGVFSIAITDAYAIAAGAAESAEAAQ